MAKNLCLVLLLIIFTLNSNVCTVADNDKCPSKNPCSCLFGEDEINISQIGLPKSGFVDDTHDSITYFFSGCKDNTLSFADNHIIIPNDTKTELKGSLIKYTINVTVPFNTTHNITANKIETIGLTTDINYFVKEENDELKFQIVYQTKEANKSSPSIDLVCSNIKDSDLKIINPASDYLRLYSPYACPVKHKHGLSIGSVLILIFFIALAIYFTVGALLLYYVRGARDIEVIPHIDFFRELPGLVRDGIIFIFSGCKPSTVATAETYDRI